MHLTLIPLFLFLFVFLLPAQNVVEVEAIGAKDGLLHRHVRGIVEDEKGFIWIATLGGLSRFDGIEWIHYSHSVKDSTSLPTNNLDWIERLPDGLILVGGRDAPVFFFNPYANNITFHRPIVNGTSSPKMYHFSKPFMSNVYNGLLMFGIANDIAILTRYMGDGQFEEIDRMPITGMFYFYRFIREDDQGGFWNIHLNSPFRYSYIDFKNKRYSLIDEEKCSPNYPICINEQGQFGLPSKQAGELMYIDLPPAIPLKDWHTIFLDDYRNMLLTTSRGEFYKFNPEYQRLDYWATFPLGLTGLSSLYVDSRALTWLHHPFGAARFKQGNNVFDQYLSVSFEHKDIFPAGKKVYGIVEGGAKHILAFVADETNGGVYKVNINTKKSRRLNIFDTNFGAYHYGPINGSDGFVWINDFSGLIKLAADTEKYTLINLQTEVRAISEDEQQRLWLISKYGDLLLFDMPSETIIKEMKFDVPLFKGTFDLQNSCYWAITPDGLLKINQDFSTESIAIHLPQRKNRPFVCSIIPYLGYIWLGTRGGLIKFNPDNQHVVHYLEADGLPNNIIYSLVGERDNLWLGTHNGLCRFNIKTEAVKNFYQADGLTYNEFNRYGALHFKDKLFFSTLNGINAFDPIALDSSAIPSAALALTLFSKVDMNSDSTVILRGKLLDAPIKLKHDDKALTFHFALLNYDKTTENKYSYYLEGIDNKWIYNQNKTSVSYPKIPSGNYIFRVKATDKLGVAAKNELAIPIYVAPPWWRTWWAISLTVLLLASVMWTFRYYDLKRLREQSEVLHLKELNELKSRFFTNITHEFRTPLTLILGPAQQTLKELAEKRLESIKEKQKIIIDNGKRLLELVDQILEINKLESGKLRPKYRNGDIIKFLKNVGQSFHLLFWKQEIQFHFESNVETFNMDFDADKFTKIINNLISNSLKFTPQGGKIYLEVTANATNLELKVSDTGVGIAPESLPFVFDRFYQANESKHQQTAGNGVGLALTKELVLLLEGKIQVESELGQGTTFLMQFPVYQDAPKFVEYVNFEEHANLVQQDVSSLSFMLENDQLKQEDKSLILIVEDHHDMAKYLADCLCNTYLLNYAENGKIGVEKALTTIPDLIISDVMMPEMDGFELCHALKTDARTSHIPVILLTAKTAIESRITGLQGGADAYMTKPFEALELQIQVANLLKIRAILKKRYSNISSTSDEVVEHIDSQFKAIIQTEDAFMEKLKTFVANNYQNPDFNTQDMLKHLLMSDNQLRRKLTAIANTTPGRFIRDFRLAKAKDLLKNTSLTISEITYDIGLNDPRYFSRIFTKAFGVSPREFRKGEKIEE